MLRYALLVLFLVLPVLARGAEPWSPTLQYDFRVPDGSAAAIHPLPAGWEALRGDWYVTPAGKLRVQRTWPSDSVALLRLPAELAGDLAAEAEVTVGAQDVVELQLRSGEIAWGGGGIYHPVTLRVSGAERGAGTYRVRLEIVGDAWVTRLDDQEVGRGTLPPERSQYNRHFVMRAMPCGELDNLTLSVRTGLPPATNAIPLNTPEENRAATVDAAKYLDPQLPDCGFQRAIDALPPNGGCVILPAGRFLLRRHLVLRSHMTLRGQGAGVTTLEHVDTSSAKIAGAESAGGVHRVTCAEPPPFRVGDAVCYGTSWGQPGQVGVESATPNRGVFVLAIEGVTLTLSEPPPPGAKQVTHVFPLVYARLAEFVEVKDLTLLGPAHNAGGASGRFMNNPLTFGAVAAARVSRVEARRYPGDGFSFQGANDLLVTDCTVSETDQGFHPGTTTRRAIFARNLAYANRSTGLYFCWYNSLGLYYQNTLDGITGYADAGDFFNLLACNDITRPDGLTITRGAAGLLYANRFAGPIHFSGQGAPPGQLRHLYEAAPRYFLLAENETPQIVFDPPAKPGTTRPVGNLLANNRTQEPIVWNDVSQTDNLVVTSPAPVPPPGPVGCGRTTPVPPPTYPEPILDGAAFYHPSAPDGGFGKALEQLKPTGGTLLLPAGRYVLKQPLSVPSRVTLAGQGLSTVLVGEHEGPLVVVSEGQEQVTVRDLRLVTFAAMMRHVERRGAWSAVWVVGARQVRLEGLAVQTAGFRALYARETEVLTVQDCHALADSWQYQGALVTYRSSGVRVATSLLSSAMIEGGRDIALVGSLVASVAAAPKGEQRPEGVLIAANVTSTLCRSLHLGQPAGPVGGVTGFTLLANLAVGRPESSPTLHPLLRGQAWYNLLTDDLLTAPPWMRYPEETEAHANLLAPLYRQQPELGLPPDNLARTFLPAGTSFEEMPAAK